MSKEILLAMGRGSAPEPRPRWIESAAEPCEMGLFQCRGAGAHGGDEVVHEKAV